MGKWRPRMAAGVEASGPQVPISDSLYSTVHMFHIVSRCTFPAFVCGLSCLWGCTQREEITQYTIPKEPPRSDKLAALPPTSLALQSPHNGGEAAAIVDPATGPDRMLGAIVVRSAQLWFFKLTGPEAIVGKFQPAFVDFVRTVKFTGSDDSPTWQLPEGWTEDRTRAMRLATLQFDVEGTPLEIAISSLPNRGDDVDAALQANIDRWRGQLGLPPAPLTTLKKDPDRFQTIAISEGIEATLVNFRGKLSANSMAPFAR